MLGEGAARAEVHRFDFGDASKLDAQTKAQQQRHASFLQRAHERHLARFWIGEVMFVAAEPGGSFPKAVANLHHLIVLGVHHVFGQRQPLRIVSDDGREVLIHDAFETGAVAVERNGSRRR